MNQTLNSAQTWLRDAAARYGGKAVVLGKGPSGHGFDPSAFPGHLVIGLNETGLTYKVDVAFVIDEDILLRSGSQLIDAVGQALIVPRVMHSARLRVGGLTWYGPTREPQPDAPWRRSQPHKHFHYNLATATEHDTSLGDVYGAFSFSAPTLVNLLARNGFREVVLAGVDGGSAYAPTYREYEYKKLRAVQSDFSIQFSELRSIRAACGVSISSVRCRAASILVGAEPEQALADQVLRWSIVSNSFLDIKFVSGAPQSAPTFASGKAGTPFSFQRLFLPELSGRVGRGLYFDSDMLVFRDVFELLNADMESNVLLSCAPTGGRAAQYSVFLVDNAIADWQAQDLIDRYQRGELDYPSLMHLFSFAHPKAAGLSSAWNSLEEFEKGVTANLHYTDMHRQPWLSTANPLSPLWCEALFAALDANTEVGVALARSLDAGWVRPSLKWQVDKREPDPWRIPDAVQRADARWMPPHVALQRAALPSRWHLLRWNLSHRLRRLGETRNGRRLRYVRDIARKILKSS